MVWLDDSIVTSDDTVLTTVTTTTIGSSNGTNTYDSSGSSTTTAAVTALCDNETITNVLSVVSETALPTLIVLMLSIIIWIQLIQQQKELKDMM